MAHVNLQHHWVYDPQVKPLVRLVAGLKSPNSTVDAFVTYSDNDPNSMVLGIGDPDSPDYITVSIDLGHGRIYNAERDGD